MWLRLCRCAVLEIVIVERWVLSVKIIECLYTYNIDDLHECQSKAQLQWI